MPISTSLKCPHCDFVAKGKNAHGAKVALAWHIRKEHTESQPKVVKTTKVKKWTKKPNDNSELNKLKTKNAMLSRICAELLALNIDS